MKQSSIFLTGPMTPPRNFFKISLGPTRLGNASEKRIALLEEGAALLDQSARHLARHVSAYVVTVWAPQTGN